MNRKIQMADVVRAHMEVSGCPVLTSNQCHAIAINLNCQIGLVSAYDEAKERELFANAMHEMGRCSSVNGVLDDGGLYYFKSEWEIWLSCAKSRAGTQS